MVGWFAAWRATRAARRAARHENGIDLIDPPYGLSLLLKAARAPATAAELAGEQQAVDQLVAVRRAALLGSVDKGLKSRVLPTARKLVVQVAAGLALLLVIASVAAETGSLPDPLQQRVHDMFSLLGVPAPVGGHEDAGAPQEPAPSPTAPVPSPSRTPHPSGSVAPAPAPSDTADPGNAEARALCQAWYATGRKPDGRTMNRQSWWELVRIAGGKNRVAAMCTALLGKPSPAPRPSARPSHSHTDRAMPSKWSGGKTGGGRSTESSKGSVLEGGPDGSGRPSPGKNGWKTGKDGWKVLPVPAP